MTTIDTLLATPAGIEGTPIGFTSSGELQRLTGLSLIVGTGEHATNTTTTTAIASNLLSGVSVWLLDCNQEGFSSGGVYAWLRQLEDHFRATTEPITIVMLGFDRLAEIPDPELHDLILALLEHAHGARLHVIIGAEHMSGIYKHERYVLDHVDSTLQLGEPFIDLSLDSMVFEHLTGVFRNKNVLTRLGQDVDITLPEDGPSHLHAENLTARVRLSRGEAA